MEICENPEIFENEDMDQDMNQDMNQDIEVDKSEEKEMDVEDERPVQEILSELALEARNSLNTYNNAVTRLEAVLKNIDDTKEIHIKVCGIKRKFRDFIEECAIESREQLKKEGSVNFGQLLLKGLEEEEQM